LSNKKDKSCSFSKLADKDWDDIKFGVENQVDYYAVSFVKDAQVVHELKDYLRSNIYSLLYKQYVDIVLSVS
jgi:pyruvate kinase